jgi:hypothetical protein
MRTLRPAPAPEPVVRFETAPGHQAQVDFAHCRLPWGVRYALGEKGTGGGTIAAGLCCNVVSRRRRREPHWRRLVTRRHPALTLCNRVLRDRDPVHLVPFRLTYPDTQHPRNPQTVFGTPMWGNGASLRSCPLLVCCRERL